VSERLNTQYDNIIHMVISYTQFDKQIFGEIAPHTCSGLDEIETAWAKKGKSKAISAILDENLAQARALASVLRETKVRYDSNKNATAEEATADLYDEQLVSNTSEKGRAQEIMDSFFEFFDYIVELSKFIDKKATAGKLKDNVGIPLCNQVSELASVYLKMFRNVFTMMTEPLLQTNLLKRYIATPFHKLAENRHLGQETKKLDWYLTA
jgi:hypothetical protein